MKTSSYMMSLRIGDFAQSEPTKFPGFFEVADLNPLPSLVSAPAIGMDFVYHEDGSARPRTHWSRASCRVVLGVVDSELATL